LTAQQPETFRATLFEGFSPEDTANYSVVKQAREGPMEKPALSGRVTLGAPFDLKSDNGYFEIKGTLTRANNKSLHFKGHAQYRTCDSQWDDTLPGHSRDFVAKGITFSSILFSFFVRFEPVGPKSP